MRRLFAAIPVTPEPPLLELMQQGQLLFSQGRVRWANPRQMHLTLKFFGEVPEEQIPDIARHLEDCTGKAEPFRFGLKGTGVFGSRYDPRVLWVGTTNDTPLRQLGEAVLDAATAAGFPRERLPFVPHLTLARIDRLISKDRFQEYVAEHRNDFFQEVQANTVYLYESQLKSHGAEHILLQEFSLGKSHKSGL